MVYKTDGFDISSLLLNETIFHNANGYIGVRSCFEEGYAPSAESIRGMYVNGFYNIAEMKQAENLYGFVNEKQVMVNIADTQGISLTVCGEIFSLFTGEVLEFSRELDMDRGLTTRRAVWRSPQGREIELSVRRMTSFVQLSLFTIEYTVRTLNFSGEVILTSRHIGKVTNYSKANDPRVASERHEHIVIKDEQRDGNAGYILSSTSKSGLEVCTGVGHSSNCGAPLTYDGMDTVLCYNADKEEAVTLIKYTVVSDSRRHKDCLSNAKDEMTKALAVPLQQHYAEQERYLKQYWERCALFIDGDESLNLAVRYNQYQLLQSVTKDNIGNIAAKGLSGEGYEGHYFWDTEMYIQPVFLLTMPDLVKNLISFRFKTLDYARENAKILGHKRGALFPWRTIMGSECSGYFPSGTAQYHINGDIGYSVIQYFLATGDMRFIEEAGAELLLEISRLWLDVGHFYNERFLINCVTGPDEYTCMVNNNYYTNAMAKYNLLWMVKFLELMRRNGTYEDFAAGTAFGEDEISMFRRAADAMYLPYDEALGISPQDDSFLSKPVWNFEGTPKELYPLLLHYHPLHLYRYQVCKQADVVMAHCILEDFQSLDTVRKSFEYYEKITTHDSSLSTCVFSIVASRLGLDDKAYDYFGESAKLDLFNTHGNTGDGIHTANMGGTYMAIVYGFAGLRVKEDGIHISPNLPKCWRSLDFRASYKGSVVDIKITHGNIEVKQVSGSPCPVFTD